MLSNIFLSSLKGMTGCSRQTTKKYRTRKSPPYPANKCCSRTKKGNDGKMYQSKRSSAGVCTWIAKSRAARKKTSTPQLKSVLKKHGSRKSRSRVTWAPKRKWKTRTFV